MEEKKIQETPKIKISVPINMDKIKAFFEPVLRFFHDKNNSGKVVLLLAVLSVVWAVYLISSVYSTLQTLNAKTPELINLTTYDTTTLSTNRITKEALSFSTSIYDLIKKDDEVKQDIEKYTKYMRDLQLPYENFLEYVYLPSLNVWKDVYTNQINTDMIGTNFLKKNPYNDVVLLQKWSDFFKDVGDNNEFNDVSDVSIGDITETPDGYFSIPITVAFTANSKRSFLMLVDKLSVTSNRNTLSLIDEFFYYLRQEIKKQKQPEIASLVADYSSVLGLWLAEDTYIWYALYNRIFGSGENTLIDDSVIEQSIKGLMFCDNVDMNQCYYQFREKYRDIAVFAYSISKDLNNDVVANFKNFFATLPPITTIQNFTFDKVKSSDLNNFNTLKYQWKVTINIYGKWISQEEIDQIALVLGKQCFGEEKTISVDEALSLVNNAIVRQSDAAWADRSKTQDLLELKTILDNVVTEYPTISNYKKIIRLFEMWRMLDDNWLCQ